MIILIFMLLVTTSHQSFNSDHSYSPVKSNQSYQIQIPSQEDLLSPPNSARTHSPDHQTTLSLLDNADINSPSAPKLLRSVNSSLSNTQQVQSQYYYHDDQKSSCTCNSKKTIMGTIAGGIGVTITTIFVLMAKHSM